MAVNVNAKQTQVAGTLDQLSKNPANCQPLNHRLVGKLIGRDRQMEKREEAEERRINREGQEDEEERKMEGNKWEEEGNRRKMESWRGKRGKRS